MVSEVETSPNQSLQDCMTTEPGRCMAINTSSVVKLSTASWEELGGEMLQGPVVLGKSFILKKWDIWNENMRSF